MVLILLLVPCLIAAFLTFDQIVRTEHDKYFSNWEQDGEPGGFSWRSPLEKSRFRSSFASQQCLFSWLFRTPSWARSDEEARRLFLRYRALVLVWNVGILALLVIVRFA